MLKPIVFVVLFSLSSVAQAQELVRVAVASNFLSSMKMIAKAFSADTGIRVDISNGASGMLYAQIRRGAPYDLYFSADAQRPKLLEEAHLIVPGSRFTYVMGKLVAWSPEADKLSPDLKKLNPSDSNLHFFAMANPKIAPYGRAGKQVLEYYGLYKALTAQNKIALGENVGKTYHYVATRNAQIGLIAKSYVSNPKKPVGGAVFDIADNLYSKIEQQAVILRGRKSAAVEKFLNYFQSEKVQKIILEYGYALKAKS